jgi:hypothetical protein
MPKFNVTLQVTTSHIYIIPVVSADDDSAEANAFSLFKDRMDNDPSTVMEWFKGMENISIDTLSVVQDTL